MYLRTKTLTQTPLLLLKDCSWLPLFLCCCCCCCHAWTCWNSTGGNNSFLLAMCMSFLCVRSCLWSHPLLLVRFCCSRLLYFLYCAAIHCCAHIVLANNHHIELLYYVLFICSCFVSMFRFMVFAPLRLFALLH